MSGQLLGFREGVGCAVVGYGNVLAAFLDVDEIDAFDWIAEPWSWRSKGLMGSGGGILLDFKRWVEVDDTQDTSSEVI